MENRALDLLDKEIGVVKSLIDNLNNLECASFSLEISASIIMSIGNLEKLVLALNLEKLRKSI